jgi:hypothetical protein
MTSRLVKVSSIFAALLLLGTAVSLLADDTTRTPISREGILGALHSSGIGIAAGQMELLSEVTAAEANPLLRVVSVDVQNAESDKVLLHCERPNTCLPFYVLVHWGPPKDDAPDQTGHAGDRLTQPGPRTEGLLVRSGKFAMLVLDGNYIHMTFPVLCLQNGGRGQKVRVISKDTKRRYLARVVGPGLVTSLLAE